MEVGSLVPISLLLLAFSTCLQISSSRKVELKVKGAKVEAALYPETETLSTEFDPSKSVQLSWHPRAFLYKEFLSDKECDHLISQARRKVGKSSLNSGDVGNSTLSTGIYLAVGQDEVISRIEKKISAWTFLPQENGENIQVSLYSLNKSRAPYYDNYHEESKLMNGGSRVATVLMHLSTVTHGGETVFKSEVKDTQGKDDRWSDCSTTGYAVKPIKGDALLVFNLHPNATMDENSLLGSCSVLEGEKWFAMKWIHARAFSSDKPLMLEASADDCTDEDDKCSHWAAIGECKRNPVFMLGTPDYFGSCRKSCGAC